MHAENALRQARHRAGLTLRQLGERAGTSHATLSAYEHGRTEPSVDTAHRVVKAAGFTIEVTLVPCISVDEQARSEELIAALELAGAFPARHAPKLRYPPFAAAARAAAHKRSEQQAR